MTATGKLWHALNRPPALHPLFQRTVLLPYYERRRSLSWAGMVIDLVMGLARHSPTILLFLIPLILPLIGITYGIDCALRVGSAIAREHENATFNLLSLSPPGPLGASWAVCASALYRDRDFERLHNIMRACAIIAGSIMAVITLFLLIGDAFSRDSYQASILMATLAHVLALVGAIYIDYVQSATLGTLVGMIVPTYTRTRIDTSLFSFGVFLLLQIGGYLMAFIVGFTLLPALFTRLGWMDDGSAILLSLCRVGALFLAREILIAGLWRFLIARLHAQPSELDAVLAPAA